jgi:molecular chaperone DnaJ
VIDETAIRIAVLSDHLDEVGYYALLEVPHDADTATIREAFHRFAERFHPDQHRDDPPRQARALAIFKRGAEAYRVLLHPVLRQRYNLVLERGLTRLSTDAMQLPSEGAAGGSVPPVARPFYDKAVDALGRGDVGSARLHLLLASMRGSSPRFEALLAQIQAAERAARGGAV